MIERPNYIDRLMRLKGPGLAKVLTGMRRAGKSGILRLLEQHLYKEGVGADALLRIDLELIGNSNLRNAQQLLDFVRSHAAESGLTYLLLDEAQEVKGIGRVAYELLEDGRFDLYLTGSHARLVERELADAMAGRFVEIPVFPLSFAEYWAAHEAADKPKSKQELFNQYLRNGGLPHTLLLENDEYALHDYLDGVYHTVIRRDVSIGLGREDPITVDAISSNLATSLGKHSSANGISKALLDAGRPCSDDTVSRYLGALTDAYAFHKMRRIDLRTGTVLKTQEKYFADDLGLCSQLLVPQGASLLGLLENVVYLELRRRYTAVYAGKRYAQQIAFVADSAQGRHYYMVATSVLDPNALKAALAPLQALRDNYPKTILTLDEIGIPSHDGILQHNVIDWLLQSGMHG